MTRTSRGGVVHAVALITNNSEAGDAVGLAYFDGSDHNAALAAVDAFEFVQNFSVTHQREVELYISNKAVRDWFEAQNHSHLVPRHFNGHGVSTIRCTAEVLLERRIAAASAAKVQPTKRIPARTQRPLIIATDASARTGHRGVGIAYVTETGAWQQKFLPSVSDIAIGELDAIHLALSDNAHRRHIEIITDSLNSIGWIEGTRRIPNRTLAGRVRQIRTLCAGRTVEFRWVKGHAGHRLNDTADRLAVAARRNGAAAIASDARQCIAQNIMDDFRASAPTQAAASRQTTPTVRAHQSA
ncbi:ribonuclease HI [Rhodococcus sp. UFZ-B548]|uniref:ribonuclease HI n=1 Tax=Rhodococcus sp. UFZ-B548 TaxID=2742212 RepID=UPI0015F75244|nr:RNase H family protein [Rhodococcus sp. UFZ-B548]